MSAATRQVIQQADEGVSRWLMGVVSGQGSSASQIIVSGVLSVVPGVGQAMDVRDLVLGVVALTANPTNPWAWADMAVTLVGLVPGFGDAFKVAFKFIRHGHPLGRVLDAVSPQLRGHVERWLRSADWGGLTRQITQQFHRVVDQFIEALDSWALRTMLGHAKVNQFLTQLKLLRHKASGMLSQAVREIQQKAAKLLEQPKPASTHATGVPSGKPGSAGGHHEQGAGHGKAEPPSKPKKVEHDNAAVARKERHETPDAQASRTNSHEKREAGKKGQKKNSWLDGRLAEHISDYYALEQRRFKKINRRGLRMEEHDLPRGRGIDHIWRTPATKIVVGETKGSIAGSLAFLALPEVMKAAGGETSEVDINDEKALTGKNADGTRMTYEHVDKEGKTRQVPARGLNETKTLGTQMSHKWIMLNIPKEEYATPKDKAEMVALAEAFKKKGFKGSAPWGRWILMVTKPQFVEHRSKGGHVHVIRRPVLSIADNTPEY